MKLLRKLGQPILLFGEEHEARVERYHAVHAAIMATKASDEDLELKQGQMFNETQLYDVSGRAKQEGVQADHEDAPLGEDGKPVVVDAAFENDQELEASFVASTPEQLISKHFKTLIKHWETEMNARPAALVQSANGRKDTATYLQCRRHMKPFFKHLAARDMPLDILNTMIEITHFMGQREYVKANDSYIKCAIGSAPWPMGVSGTGVHERQGRQHIRESAVANVMNNETQRKYLQSVKRLITFAQNALPPTGPSKTVN
jgi:pre-mRNA-splicing factor 18